MTEYTPSMDEVRHQYTQSAPLNVWHESGRDFDRFVAKVQADARSQVIDYLRGGGDVELNRLADELGEFFALPTAPLSTERTSYE